MYGVEKRFKMQLLLGLKGSPLVGATILNFVTPESFEETSQPLNINLPEICKQGEFMYYTRDGRTECKNCEEEHIQLPLV